MEHTQPQAPIYPESVSQPPVIGGGNPSKKALPILSALLALVVVGAGGYYLGTQQAATISEQSAATQTETKTVQNSPQPRVSPSPQGSMDLASVINASCVDAKIAVENLPLNIAAIIQQKYAMNSGLSCLTEENYITTQTRTADGNLPISTVYLFDDASVWMGYGDAFKDIAGYQTIKLGTTTYALDVQEPGPFGISTNGVWVDLIGEKKLGAQTILRSISFKIIDNDEALALVKRYGVSAKLEDFPDYPEYRVELSQVAAFKAAFVELAQKSGTQTNAELLTAARSIDGDLNGINLQ